LSVVSKSIEEWGWKGATILPTSGNVNGGLVIGRVVLQLSFIWKDKTNEENVKAEAKHYAAEPNSLINLSFVHISCKVVVKVMRSLMIIWLPLSSHNFSLYPDQAPSQNMTFPAMSRVVSCGREERR
jgi:hypothetical protein